MFQDHSFLFGWEQLQILCQILRSPREGLDLSFSRVQSCKGSFKIKHFIVYVVLTERLVGDGVKAGSETVKEWDREYLLTPIDRNSVQLEGLDEFQHLKPESLV